MNFDQIPLMSMISARLSWLGQRQQVLAENVANVETPGYQPRDLRPLDFDKVLDTQQASSRAVAMTHPAHLSGLASERGFDLAPPKKAEVTDATGNAVLMEHELMKVSETAMDYQLTTNLYRKSMGMLRTALGRPTGG